MPVLGCPRAASVAAYDHRLDDEQAACTRMDGDLDPMHVRAAESLEPREVRQQIRLIDERLVVLEKVRVAVNQHDLPVEAPRLLRQRPDEVVVAGLRALVEAPALGSRRCNER